MIKTEKRSSYEAGDEAWQRKQEIKRDVLTASYMPTSNTVISPDMNSKQALLTCIYQ